MTKKRMKENINSVPTKRGRQMSKDKEAAFSNYKKQRQEK